MPQAVDSIASSLEQLTQKLETLERRVAALEGHPEPWTATPQSPATALQRPRPPATWRGFPPVEGSSAIVPILGKAVLGIAGAYLLRALAEMSSVPKSPVLLIAILYAYFWLILGARVYQSSRFASATYGVTSALILSPLLWESTVRFQALSPAMASVGLLIFVLLGIAIDWSRQLQLLPGIVTAASLGTAIALIVGTRDLAPLTAAILAIALVVEGAACLGRNLTVRVLPSLAASFAVWLLVYVMTSSEGIPEGYHAVAARTMVALSLLLMTIYGVSIAFRNLRSGEKMTVLDIVQGVLAFAVGSYGALRAGPGAAMTALGGLFLVLAMGCYWGALFRLAEAAVARNRRIFATWACALFLAGSFLLFPGKWQPLFLGIAGVAAAFAYARTGKISLGIHASVYLAAGAILSPFVNYVADVLAGALSLRPDWRFWTVALFAAFCYRVGSVHVEENPRRRLLWIVPALLLGFAIAAFVVDIMASISVFQGESRASILSVLRTVTISMLALVFGFGGSRLRRLELRWAAYATVGLGTVKLVLEDLRFGNAASLVVSLLFYGLILILLPRMGQFGDRGPSGAMVGR